MFDTISYHGDKLSCLQNRHMTSYLKRSTAALACAPNSKHIDCALCALSTRWRQVRPDIQTHKAYTVGVWFCSFQTFPHFTPNSTCRYMSLYQGFMRPVLLMCNLETKIPMSTKSHCHISLPQQVCSCFSHPKMLFHTLESTTSARHWSKNVSCLCQ